MLYFPMDNLDIISTQSSMAEYSILSNRFLLRLFLGAKLSDSGTLYPEQLGAKQYYRNWGRRSTAKETGSQW